MIRGFKKQIGMKGRKSHWKSTPSTILLLSVFTAILIPWTFNQSFPGLAREPRFWKSIQNLKLLHSDLIGSDSHLKDVCFPAAGMWFKSHKTSFEALWKGHTHTPCMSFWKRLPFWRIATPISRFLQGTQSPCSETRSGHRHRAIAAMAKAALPFNCPTGQQNNGIWVWLAWFLSPPTGFTMWLWEIQRFLVFYFQSLTKSWQRCQKPETKFYVLMAICLIDIITLYSMRMYASASDLLSEDCQFGNALLLTLNPQLLR